MALLPHNLEGNLRYATVDWSFPRRLELNWYNENLREKGLYYISRKFGGKETLLYIGKTSDKFYNRFCAHYWSWMPWYRGEKYFRLGIITYPERPSDMGQLIIDVESALIYTMQPKVNWMSKKNIAPRHEYIITNTGYRGELHPEISMRDFRR